MRLPTRLAIVVGLQTLVLVTMIGMKQWTLSTGTPIVLETRPIDPRSLFRGDYVRFNYAISRLDLEELGGDKAFRPHDRIYVVLEQGERYWKPISVHRSRPEVGPGQVAIKGEIWSIWPRQSRQAQPDAEQYLHVRYGIENYFVPEGEGRRLERPKPGDTVSVQVAVDRFGNAGIKVIFVNGEPRYVESLF